MKRIALPISMFVWLISSPTFTNAQQLPLNEPVPDVTAFDESGNPFPLREKLKGQYSVIVFGCLT